MKGTDYLLRPMQAARMIAILVFCSVFASTAWAECGVNNPESNLGNVSSLSLIEVPQRGSAAGGFYCTGLLQLLSTAYIRVSLVNSDFRLTGSQGGSIPFSVFADSGFTQPLLAGQLAQFGAGNLLNLGGLGAGVPLYFSTALGANVPAGTYTGTVTLRWHWAVCGALGIGGICTWERSPGVVQNCLLGCGAPTNWGTGVVTTIRVTLVVTKACQFVSLPAVDLGRKALVSQFSKASQALSVRCTNTEGFSLSFGNGQHYQAPWRQMARGSHRLRYNIYSTEQTLLTLGQTLDSIGSGFNQGFRIEIQVDPNQNDVPAGTYVDHVVVTLSY
jgi:spore coat protein U-like protein